MDFARKQLEKYGWSDGKGLGKHENGISQALKPTLKRSVTGIGHDPASDYTDHWWTALYDKAASNIEVEHKNGKIKKFKKKDEGAFEITNSTWRLKRKQKNIGEEQYKDFFVKKAVLTSGGAKTEKVKESEEESEEETERQDDFKMTDEELFKACEGRTAHKGARHGLKSLGKLARIERQEQMLLIQPKYEAYCNSKKCKKIVDDANVNSDSENIQVKEKLKKKKKKHCSSYADQISTETGNININTDNIVTEEMDHFTEKNEIVETVCEIGEDNIGRKSKKSKSKITDKERNDDKMPTSKKQILDKDNEDSVSMETDFDNTNNAISSESGFIKKSKKKKKRNNEL